MNKKINVSNLLKISNWAALNGISVTRARVLANEKRLKTAVNIDGVFFVDKFEKHEAGKAGRPFAKV